MPSRHVRRLEREVSIEQAYRYMLMRRCWAAGPSSRPPFGEIKQFLAARLEYVAAGYGYVEAFGEADKTVD